MTTTVQPDIPRIAPAPDELTADFWSAAARGVLAIQRCPSCDTYQHPPRPLCANCGAAGGTFVEVSGQARLVAWTETHHPVVPALAAELPYVCLVVELVEQPGLWLVSDRLGGQGGTDDLRLDLPMRVTFDAAAGSVTLPRFDPDPDAQEDR